MTQQQRAEIDRLMRAARLDTSLPPDELREFFEMYTTVGPPPAGVTLADSSLAGRPALWITPDEARVDATILYFHGGGWVYGSPRTAATLTAALVRGVGAPAVCPAYRLAPEHPFPAAIEDGLAAYRALLEQGTPPERIVVAGDSSGGGLTVGALLRARDEGLPRPACAVLFSAGLDATRSGDSMDAKEGVDPLFDRENLARLSAHYLAGAEPRQPLVSPAVVGDLGGLPPLLLQVGTNEVLLDDSTRFAVRAAHHDVDVVLDVTAGVPHVFQSLHAHLDEAVEALDRAADFVHRHLPPK
ncbi:alpha/beta hydrolase [Actinomycetospora sp. TBRC 11914]|uniref:alpha/beta hydrolase n=1 Tax=Actinomycetospora sp. TBRC 11914 TaxID=2729387 RepID=UPI00145D4505|nr:alpha/beta hydrolase [Actinomycetospora sp. TBRC 11914]NMO91936.1 alpha/beta hydrolase [Actinomycetospora sp. TBRC 11914]